MGIAITAFIVMSATIAGGWWAVTYLPDVIASRRLDRRLKDVSIPFGSEDSGTGELTVVKQRKEGPLPTVDRVLKESWMTRLIEQAGVNTTPSTIVVISLLVGLFCAVLVTMFLHQLFAWILVGAAGTTLPTVFLVRKRASRMRKFEEMFPEALDLLSRAIRAGHAFQTAMGMVADELKEPVGPEFRKTFDQQNFGLPLRDALHELMDRIRILDVRFFVTAVLIQRESGGNLAEILDNLAHVVRERFKIRRQIRVHTAHGRFTGYVLLALPAALAVALTFINPELMALLFEEHMGRMMLFGAIVLQVFGFFWIRQIMKIEV